MLQVTGVLLNDKRLLDMTNVINSDELKDAWDIDGVPRDTVKAVMTPTLYGSGETATALLNHRNIRAVKSEIKTLNRELTKGAYAVAKNLKTFMIGNCAVSTPTYKVRGWNEQYTVTVNKYKAVGANLTAYSAYDTATNKFRVFTNHSVITIPDYTRFALFVQTGLIHNLDSVLMDNTVYISIMQNKEWALPIHDAILQLPKSRNRAVFVGQLENLRKDRHSVIAKYRQSIGAVGRKADIAWAKLTLSVEQLDPSVKFEESALK